MKLHHHPTRRRANHLLFCVLLIALNFHPRLCRHLTRRSSLSSPSSENKRSIISMDRSVAELYHQSSRRSDHHKLDADLISQVVYKQKPQVPDYGQVTYNPEYFGRFGNEFDRQNSQKFDDDRKSQFGYDYSSLQRDIMDNKPDNVDPTVGWTQRRSHNSAVGRYDSDSIRSLKMEDHSSIRPDYKFEHNSGAASQRNIFRRKASIHGRTTHKHDHLGRSGYRHNFNDSSSSYDSQVQPTSQRRVGSIDESSLKQQHRRRRHRHNHEFFLKATQSFKGQDLLRSNSDPLVIGKARDFKKPFCKTMPLTQTVSSPGCKSVNISNNYCYGQCNSFYIPFVANQDGNIGFHSCPSCLPKTFRWAGVALECLGKDPPIESKMVLIIEECACMDKKKKEVAKMIRRSRDRKAKVTLRGH